MSVLERELLVAALKEHGIRYLAGGDDVSSERVELTPLDLIVRVAKHADPRLHLALTSLFLLHPEYATDVPEALSSLDKESTIELKARYMAAVYLQRLWQNRLGYYLKDVTLLPDLFSAELQLPSPDDQFGKAGLVAVAEWHRERSSFPFNRLASYQKSADLLFGQLKAEGHKIELAPAG